jgi:hypothetical protein
MATITITATSMEFNGADLEPDECGVGVGFGETVKFNNFSVLS